MPRPVSREDERRVIWQRVLEAAMRHHNRDKPYGMQKVISGDSGRGEAAVSKWAKGLSRPEPRVIRRLADLYGVSAGWLGGDAEFREGDYASDGILSKASDITEMVVLELLPDGSGEQFIEVMRRAQELLMEGKTEDQAFTQLFREVTQKKRES